MRAQEDETGKFAPSGPRKAVSHVSVDQPCSKFAFTESAIGM